MSDEYQPKEVAEAQSELEAMPASTDSEESATADRTAEAPREAHTASDETNTEVSPALAQEDVGAHEVDDVSTAIPGAEVVAEDSAKIGESAAVVSIADVAPSKHSESESQGLRFPSIGSLSKRHALVAGFVVVVLILISFFLPPMSLAQRMGAAGYTVLDSANPRVVHPDGLTVERTRPEDRIRVRLDSVPRADFVAVSAPETLAAAVAAIPDHLIPRSPYYTIDMRSREAVAGVMSVVIPNESEPWETLDLYTWDGAAWRWLPTRLDDNLEMLISVVDALPTSVMVMQSEPRAQYIAAETSDWSVELADPVLNEVTVAGLLIGTMGGTTGSIDALPAATESGQIALVPIIRNWAQGHDPNWALVSDMLAMESDRRAHVANLLTLAQDGGYTGLVVDYRRVQSQDRDRYTDFISDLAASFHDAGIWLGVVVDRPQLTEGGWDTGGYDWAALGAVVDQLRVAMPVSPEAYTPGGEFEQLIRWAVTQVERSRLMPVFSTLSTDGDQLIPLEMVLGSLGEVRAQQVLTESVKPGTRLDITLGASMMVANDPETGATRLLSGDTAYWLGTPHWLRTRLDLNARHRLGGVVLSGLFDAGNVDGLLSAVADHQAGDTTSAFVMPDIVWELTDPGGQSTEITTSFARPELVWVAPSMTGTYRVGAMVAGLDKGSLEITVSEPVPTTVDTPAETVDADVDDISDAEEVEEDETLRAGFVADVSVPDNTRFEQGASFTKTWRMRNSGNVDWPADTVWVYASGDELAAVREVEVGAVGAGETVDISVDMTAPEEDGTFRSNWQLRADGRSIRGGGAYVLIRVGEPQAAPPPEEQPPPAAAPRPVAPGGFELGGHIRDLSIPHRDRMRHAGMNWVKIQVHFGQGADHAINTAHAAGFKIQLSAIGGPAMVTQPNFVEDYTAWVAGLAAAGADAIEIWNEPNIEREWQIGHISPQAYTNLLCRSYSAIKAANPNTDVISAAPAPTGWFGGCGPNGCDDRPWMQGLYNAGAANCLDYIGAHHNAGATSPSARIGHPANPGDTHPSWFFLPQTELYYNIFRGTRQIVYTEMGFASQEGVPAFSDQFAWARGTNNAQQAAWLAEAVQLSINTGMVRVLIVWNIDFGRFGTDPQDGFAIIRPGGGCPACDSMNAVMGRR